MTSPGRRRAPRLLGLPLLAAITLAVAPLAFAGEPPLCAGHPATIWGTASEDHLQGTVHDDVI